MKGTYPQYSFIKKFLKPLGIYDPTKTGSMSSKNVFLRKFWKFFGLYPNMHAMHFYYEGANSFMAPKVYEYVNMLNGTKLKESDVVLDVGCGEGTLSLAIGKSVQKVVGVDTMSESIDNAKFKAKEVPYINAEFHCQKIEKLGFAEQSFDKVFSFSVIEHIPNYQEVFEEIFHILKEGGELIISVDSFTHFDRKLRDIHQEKFDVQKYFSKSELHELLEKVGFKNIRINPIFKSEFSKKWFIRVMKNPYEYFGLHKRFYSFFLYFLIKYKERKVKQNAYGIFLIAKCSK